MHFSKFFRSLAWTQSNPRRSCSREPEPLDTVPTQLQTDNTHIVIVIVTAIAIVRVIEIEIGILIVIVIVLVIVRVIVLETVVYEARKIALL